MPILLLSSPEGLKLVTHSRVATRPPPPIGPAGYKGDATSLSNCSLCELGYYQPIEGQVTCAKCPTETHMTGIRGATQASDCSVPKLDLRPTLPIGCTPPSCLDTPTPVDVFWTMERIDAPDGEEKTVGMSILMEFSWYDPRLVLDPNFEREFKENALTLSADGTARTAVVTISTAESRRRKLWLPPYRVLSSESGIEGELNDIDEDLETSYVTITLSPLRDDGEKLWPQQRASVHVVWSRHLEHAVVKWDSLNWYMFPFGYQPLTVELECREEALCFERLHASMGKYQIHNRTAEEIESDPTMPLVPGSLWRTSTQYLNREALQNGATSSPTNSTTKISSGSALNLNGEQNRMQAEPMQIKLTLKRDSELQVVRLIVPTILTMLLGVIVFFVEDSTWTVDMCFAVLLVLTVIAVEVKDDFPGHVTYRSWMEYQTGTEPDNPLLFSCSSHLPPQLTALCVL